MIFLIKYHTLFFRKLGKITPNLSSAAVVIGALRVNIFFSIMTLFGYNFQRRIRECLLQSFDELR